MRGYQKALAEAGVEPAEGWVKNCTPTYIHGQEAARQLIEAHPQLSAIFCYNDLVALGALRGCKELGIDVPKDMAIAGFDDIMLAGVVSPTLTTCHVPREEMGRLAASMLLNCIDKEASSCGEIVVKPKLVVRSSTGMAQKVAHQSK
jgi:LacI family transcriptional regulator